MKDTIELNKVERSVSPAHVFDRQNYQLNTTLNRVNHKKIGFIGLGGITGATLSQLVNEEHRGLLDLEDILLK